MALLHEFGQVLETRYDGEYCEIEAEIPESLQRRLATVEKTVRKIAGSAPKVS